MFGAAWRRVKVELLNELTLLDDRLVVRVVVQPDNVFVGNLPQIQESFENIENLLTPFSGDGGQKRQAFVQEFEEMALQRVKKV